MSKILEFKGTWRTYQKRVLSRVDEYLNDGKLHIVAAPGSGKTTLGIELIGKIDKPSLILVPTITIREQWIARINEGFLNDGIALDDVVSNSLKKPKFITVATYQALHSAMTRYKGIQTEDMEEINGDTDDVSDTSFNEEVDYSKFDLINVMKDINLGIICLDECHHLRNEWWKELENFRKMFEDAKIISLTATPPYDVTPTMWNRYINMCGEIDEEITIPELVKEGSLCPHQDYVLFNYPTREEELEIEKFKNNSESMYLRLMKDNSFDQAVISHKAIFGEVSNDRLLDNPAQTSAVLIYLNEKKIAYPRRVQTLLGAKNLPPMDEQWMEHLLQGMLYDNTDLYDIDNVYREMLIKELKSLGLIEKKKVCLTTNSVVEKMLIRSKGKIESIKDIVKTEYKNMGSELRMLILTDYIRREYEKNIGDEDVDVNQLGVLPFFEILRRESEQNKGNKKLRFGVLCGSIVTIHAEAREHLLKIVDNDKVTFSQVGKLSMDDYLVVNAIGNAHFLTAAVTDLFTNGHIEVLIGTKSLLGEGWDAPCVNSLILASFVGSFMLSNQMRGRAIRKDANNPNKTSNIWHLVCISPWERNKQFETGENSLDYKMLTRRMEHFLGLHYDENTIENGVNRLTAINLPFTKANVEKTNKKMLSTSGERNTLNNRWQQSLAILDKMEVADQVDVSDRFITYALFFDAIRLAAVCALMNLAIIGFCVLEGIEIFKGVGFFVLLIITILFIYFFVKSLMFSSPLRRLKVIGEGIRKAMIKKGMLSSENCKVVTDSEYNIQYLIYLMGGTGREKADFANCMVQIFSEIDNQRYILVKKQGRKKLDGFLVVPDAFSKNKEDAMLFAECIKHSVGKYDLVYTRNEEGRRLLLEGRLKALSNKEERCLRNKKVKGALE